MSSFTHQAALSQAGWISATRAWGTRLGTELQLLHHTCLFCVLPIKIGHPLTSELSFDTRKVIFVGSKSQDGPSYKVSHQKLASCK